MEALTAVLLILVAVAVLYAVAGRVGLPYPTLFVLGGLALAFIPGLPRIRLEPDLVLRDSREINDETLRLLERELDLEELRMEG